MTPPRPTHDSNPELIYCGRCDTFKSSQEFYFRKDRGKPLGYCQRCIRTLNLQRYHRKQETIKCQAAP